jgi:hypothetical protein
MTRGFWLALVAISILALALRVPLLEQRPMHGDEAVHADKLRAFWERGTYRYDPREFHGPTLYYATLPIVWLSSARHYADLKETTLRLVPVIFGVGLVLLSGLLRDALGHEETLYAALLTAISPAMVFYSRYYIHEMLLVFFTLLLVASTWRYASSPRLGWALLAGASLGLMYATKETFIIALVAMAASAATTALCGQAMGLPRLPVRVRPRWTHCAAALAAALIVSVTLFSSFFTNPRGPVDSLRAYLPWLHRAGFPMSPLFRPNDFPDPRALINRLENGSESLSRFLWSQCDAESKRLLTDPSSTTGQLQSILAEALNKVIEGDSIYETQRFAHVALAERTRALAAQKPLAINAIRLNRLLLEEAYPSAIASNAPSPHIHPWHFYVERLFFFHRGFGPVWSEALILLLALVGLATAFRTTSSWGLRVAWLRFLGFYVVVLTAEYALISYKTPWCALGFLHGMILLGGVGAAGALRLVRRPWLKAVMGAGLMLATVQLGLQSKRTSFVFYEDRRNPYVYAHAVSDVRELADRVMAITRIQPQGKPVSTAVAAPANDYWPLPWYLRSIPVGWYSDLSDLPDADLVVASLRFKAALSVKLGRTHEMIGLFGLRPGTFLQLFVRRELWRDHIERLMRQP